MKKQDRRRSIQVQKIPSRLRNGGISACINLRDRRDGGEVSDAALSRGKVRLARLGRVDDEGGVGEVQAAGNDDLRVLGDEEDGFFKVERST